MSSLAALQPLLAAHLLIVFCQSQSTESAICPTSIHGCSEFNECESCFEACGYCQNTLNSTCTESHCMTCDEALDYTLVPISSDGSGYCEYTGYQQQASFSEFQNTIKNHDIFYQTSNDDTLSITPLFSITFLYSHHILIFGGLLFQSSTSILSQKSDYLQHQIYISSHNSDSLLSESTCCDCTSTSGSSGCDTDPLCEDIICVYLEHCCDEHETWDIFCAEMAMTECSTMDNHTDSAISTWTPYNYIPSIGSGSGSMCCDCVSSKWSKGCAADPSCEDYICGYDEVCCSQQWDQYCAEDASFECDNSFYSYYSWSTTRSSNNYPISAITAIPTAAPTAFDTDYKVTCPGYVDGCSIDNICDECYYLCTLCQNTDASFTGAICTENDCMRCVDGYEIIEDNTDGTGSCALIPTTPSPTAEYLLPEILDWSAYDLDDLFGDSVFPFCISQCYTTPYIDYGADIDPIQADKVYVLFPFNCKVTAPVLFELHPDYFINGTISAFDHQTYDLSEYLCDDAIFNVAVNKYHPFQLNEVCMTWHPLDHILYIIYRDRILLYNVNQNTAQWSNATLSDINPFASRGCTVDQWMKYVWLTDDDAKLLAYDIFEDAIIDVGAYNTEHYPVEYYTDSSGYHRINATTYYYSYYDVQYPRMIPLNDDFILISSARSHHILKSNTTSHNHTSSGTQTKYGDVLCHGYLPSNLQTFSAPVYSDFKVVHFGAFSVNESNCALFSDDGDFHNCTKHIFPHQNISYFEWQNNWRLVLAPVSSSLLFGDRLIVNNQLIGVCDLSFYYDKPLLSNPFGIEVYIESEITVSTFMYIINITSYESTDSSTYYGASKCYLCPDSLDFEPETFDDEEAILFECVLCTTGIRTSVTDKSLAGSAYDVYMELRDFYGNLMVELQSTEMQIFLRNCDPGHGIAAGSSVFDCNECPFNQFSLRSELKPCIACSGGNEGIECEGGNRTILTYNWWVAAYDPNTAELKSFYEVTNYDSSDYDTSSEVPNDDDIITVLCPPKYCCQSVIGCDYLSQYLSLQSNESQQTSMLCAPGRDVRVPLCGACLPGYAEMLGTTKCGNTCDREYLALLPVTYLFTFILAVYVVFFDSKPRTYTAENDVSSNTKEINVMRLLKRDAMDGFQTIIFKPLLYYFQSLSPILNTRGITLWLSPVLSFFNFSLDVAGSGGSSICWSATLNANTEILLNLVFPVLLLLNILTPCFCIKNSGQCRLCRHGPTLKVIGIEFIPYYAASFFRVLLIIIGVVLTVCFKYLTFVKVGDEQLMFYSADTQAFGVWWISGFIGIICIIICFAFMFWQLRKQDIDYRFASVNKYRKFVKSYKRQYWFWEFVLFSRRFFVALFTSIQFVGGDYSNFFFVLVLVIYLCLQIHFKPFAYTRVNRLETLCLILLLAAFISANFVRLNDDDVFVAVVLSSCIIIPLILICWYAVQIVRFNQKIKIIDEANQSEEITNRILHKDLSKMMKRAPKSFKDILTNTGMQIGEFNDDERDDEDDDVLAYVSPDIRHIDLVNNSYKTAATVSLKPGAKTADGEAGIEVDVIKKEVELIEIEHNDDNKEKDNEDDTADNMYVDILQVLEIEFESDTDTNTVHKDNVQLQDDTQNELSETNEIQETNNTEETMDKVDSYTNDMEDEDVDITIFSPDV